MTKLLQLPLVSFIVTSYCYEKFILKTLESIKNQSYENIEIIVVDDKSPDNSVELVKGFIEKNKDLSITLIEQPENVGQMATMQTGLRAAKGQFISFIDADDILIKDYAKTLIRVHMATSVSFVTSQLIEIGENDEIHTTYSYESFQKEKCLDLRSLDDLLNVDVDNVDYKLLTLKVAPFGGWFWAPTSANMFRKAALDLFLEYDTPENWKICADKFVLNFAHLLGCSALVYAPLVAYRRHGANGFASNMVCGSRCFHRDKARKLIIEDNKKIRQDTLKFIFRHKKEFEEKLGRRSVRKIISQILLSYFRMGITNVLSALFYR